MYDIERVEPEQYDLVAIIKRRPDVDPVQEYLDSLDSEASVSTMEQALGVVVALLAGQGRPDNKARQAREERKAKAQAMKQAAHDYDWFAFDGKKAKQLIAVLSTENYADSSREKMVAAVVGVLDEVEAINVQMKLDAQTELDDVPMSPAERLTYMQMADLYYGRLALTIQSAKTAIKKAKQADRKARKEAAKKARESGAAPAPITIVTPVTVEQPTRTRKRRSDAIDRTTAGKSKHRQLSKREMRAIWGVCAQQGKIGVRNMAIIALGFGCGLRRSEIVALQYEDIDWKGKIVGQTDDGEQSRELPVGEDADDTAGMDYLPITIEHGKGDKKRVVNASNGARLALLQWKALRGEEPGPLFYSWHKHNGMQVGKPIDSQVIYALCDELATRAKIEKFSPHDMRRTFISGFLTATGDISMAAQLAGHSNIQTTTIYDRRGEDAKAQASAKHVHVPYEPVPVQSDLA